MLERSMFRNFYSSISWMSYDRQDQWTYSYLAYQIPFIHPFEMASNIMLKIAWRLDVSNFSSLFVMSKYQYECVSWRGLMVALSLRIFFLIGFGFAAFQTWIFWVLQVLNPKILNMIIVKPDMNLIFRFRVFRFLVPLFYTLA